MPLSNIRDFIQAGEKLDPLDVKILESENSQEACNAET